MTVNGWLQILLVPRRRSLAVTPAGGPLHDARVHRRADLARSGAAPGRAAASTGCAGIDAAREMRWTEYAGALLAFSAVSMLVLYAAAARCRAAAVQPAGVRRGVRRTLAFNTAASFTTNTNWQAYAGETTMSYLTQMAGLAYHNFVSAAVGIALAIAFIRGIARREQDTIGNFWVDIDARSPLDSAARLRRRRAACSCRRASSRTSSPTTS